MARPERPLDSAPAELADFAAGLRELRRTAGNAPYRKLSQRAHYSATALSEAAGGRQLPSLAVTLAYVTACGGDPDEWQAKWEGVSRVLETPTESPDDTATAPYVGLSAFGVDDADLFFGREGLVDELEAKMARKRFVAVFGASGAGKTSLLRAGLLPRLVDGGARTVLFTPGRHPWEECAVQLARLTGVPAPQAHADLVADPRNLHRIVRQANPDQSDLVVVVDQFEEVFTLCDDPDERRGFITAICDASNTDTSGCRVVIGVRADFYAHCTQYPELVAALTDAHVAVGPMTTDELRQAIVQPAIRSHGIVEGALVAELIAQATGHTAVLPLLSHALLESWRRRRGNTITVSGYEAAGGIRGALAQTAENSFLSLDPDQRHAAKQLFLRLVALGQGTEDTKRRVPRRELDVADDLLDRLAAARLITLDHDSVELTHEAVIRSWPRLRDWIAEDRDLLRIHRQLTDATDVWEAHGRDPDTLYSGSRLIRAQESLGDVVTTRERAFLDASTAGELSRQVADRRRTRRLKQLVAMLSVLVLLFAGAVVVAVNAEREAARQRNTALALKAAGEVADMLDGDPAKAVKVALAARALATTPETAEALVNANAAIGQQSTTLSSSYSPATFSPHADIAVTPKNGDTPAMLWSVSGESAARTAYLDLDDALVRISADAKVMLTCDRKTYRTDIWDISDPGNPRKAGTLPGRQDVQALSENGRTALTTEVEESGREIKPMMWDLTDFENPKQLALPTTHLTSMRPDGRGLVTLRLSVNEPIDWTSSQFIDMWSLTADGQWSLQNSAEMGEGGLTYTTEYDGNGHFLTEQNLLASPRMRVWQVHDDGSIEKWVDIDTESPGQAELQLTDDGHYAFTDNAGMLRIWNIEKQLEPRLVTTVRGHGALAMIPLVHDNTLRFYDSRMGMWQLDLDVDRVMSRLCQDKGQELTPAEWTQYFPGAPQRSSCSR
ncbi:helix-turn-helix domain-containing protein [Umezawaea sp. Da 62-37]|uniref:nSTAND1 domain-containing NTPase n=1 Tax=Umezawaea sp. Da 62-37 TaxID=3075927 RepID=UPI0028F6E0DE|nr:helix-turn-helix domain-containing protein [Umezawaea sp. Da 62-37]WNV87047.1 hypothetical protein RM788_01780 [Umezawaea sp. Da 62-37]